MTQAHERSATLSELVAEEVRALMARRRMSGRQLATTLGVSPSWVSYRLTGVQPIDVNDMHLMAGALGVEVHDLLPSREQASRAVAPKPQPAIKRRSRGREDAPGLNLSLTGLTVPVMRRRDSTGPGAAIADRHRRPAHLRPSVRAS